MTTPNDDLDIMSVQDNYKDMELEELQKLIEDLSIQVKAAKQTLRDKRLAGVNAAVEARREADAELAEELKKLGYPHAVIPSASLMNESLSTTLRNLYRITNVRI